MGGVGLGSVSDAVRVTRLLSLLTVLFDPLAGFIAQRAASLLYLLDGLGLLDFLADFFRDDLFGFEVFAHPAAHLFGDLDEPLHWREAGCPVLAHGHRAHEADRPEILARGGRRRRYIFLEPIRAAATEFAQLLPKGHPLAAALAFMPIGDPAGEPIGVIGE